MSHWAGGGSQIEDCDRQLLRESPSTGVHVLECKQDLVTHF